MLETLRSHLCRQVEESSLVQWFDPLSLSLDTASQCITVRFPHMLFGRWFDQTARPTFESAVADLFPDYSLDYSTGAGNFLPSERPDENSGTVNITDFSINDAGKFTFETFLSNRKNEFPLTSALQIAQHSDNGIYNPFVVTGGSGCGKTHLLRAIATEARRLKSYGSIFSGTVDDLPTMTPSPRARKKASLFDRYDMILLDDIQRIAPMQERQRDLVLLCDAAKDVGKQLVVACSGRLSAYPGIHPSLRSRLESGLNVELREPDLDIRTRFIQRQCRELKLRLSKEQVLPLAQRFKQLRPLEGVIARIAAYCSLMKRNTILPKEFDQILEHTDSANMQELTPEHIIRVTAAQFSLTSADLTGASRKYGIVQARQFAMLLCRELLGLSYPALGRLFGGKDHTTALYAVTKILKLREHNKDIQDTFNNLKQLCAQAPHT